MVSLSAAITPPREAQQELARLCDAVMAALGGLDDPLVGPVRLPITGFGNVTTPDAGRLVAALAEAVQVVDEALVVRFSGVAVAPDGTVRVGMGGDVDALVELARFVPIVVQRLRLYTDRRRFWPGVVLGRTTADPAALGDLGEWEGSDWAVPAISILRRSGDELVSHVEAALPVPTATPS